MRILEKYKEKVKIINDNNELEFITIEEYNNIIKKHNNKIFAAKKWAEHKAKLDKLKILYEIEKLKKNGEWNKIWEEFKHIVEGGGE